MIKNIFLFIFIFLTINFSGSARIGFWRTQNSRVVFETAAQSIFQHNCSGIVTLRHKNAQNINLNVSTNLNVTLEAVAGITYYSDSACTLAITSATISSGSSSTNFYFVSDTTGTTNISISTSTYGQIVQSTTINTNPFIWTGGGADSNWATALNWSGGVAPNSSQVALFTTCASNCSPTIAANLNVGGIRMLSGYNGTITQNSTRTITVGTSHFVQYGGTFSASSLNDTITFNGRTQLLGGIFNANATTISQFGNWTVNGGTFNKGTSLIDFKNALTITVGSESYNSIKITNTGFGAINISGTMNVDGDLYGNAPNFTTLNGGTINAKSNIYLSNYGFNVYPSTTLIKLAGNADQVISSSSSTASFPRFEIASTGGTISFLGTSNFTSHYTYTSGVIDYSASTIVFGGIVTSTITVPSTYPFNNVTIQHSSITTTISGTMIVNGTLTGNANSFTTLTGGSIEARGDIVLSNYGLAEYSSSTTLFKINGTSNQTITGSGIAPAFQKLEINKASGTLNLVGTIIVRNTYTFSSGTLNAGTSTLLFSSDLNFTVSSSGAESYYNVSFINNGNITISGKITVSNSLNGAVVNSLSNITGGEIDLFGNLTLANFGLASYNTSTTKINMLGASPTITSSGSNAFLSELVLAPSSGNVTFSGTIGARIGTTVNSGNVALTNSATQLSTKTLTLNGNTFTKNGGILIVNSNSVGTGVLFGGTINP